MDYKKVYNNLMESRRYRGTKRKRGDGYDKHHIIPRCMGGEDKESNYILLTYREHLIAHLLLYKIYSDSLKLAHAVHQMIYFKKYYKITEEGKKVPFSTRELEEIRKKSNEFLRQKNLGKKHSPESKQKMREAKLGTKASPETRALLSKIRMGHSTSEATREKLSKARKGIRYSEEQIEKLRNLKKGVKLSQEAKDAISGKNSTSARKIVDGGGNIYDTMGECMEKFGILSRDTLKDWIKKGKHGLKFLDGLTPEEFSKNRIRKVQGPDGTVYENCTDCGKKINRNRNTIKRWIEKFPEMGYRYVD